MLGRKLCFFCLTRNVEFDTMNLISLKNNSLWVNHVYRQTTGINGYSGCFEKEERKRACLRKEKGGENDAYSASVERKFG